MHRHPFERLLPELAYFDTLEDKHKVFEAACKPLRARVFLFIAAPLACVIGPGVLILLRTDWARSLLMSLESQRTQIVTALLGASSVLILAVFGLAACAFCTFRGRIRTSLRRELSKRGFAVCVVCGYDLRGGASGCCPECGAELAPSDHPLELPVPSDGEQCGTGQLGQPAARSKGQWLSLVVGIFMISAAVFRIIRPLDSWNTAGVSLLLFGGIIQIFLFVRPRPKQVGDSSIHEGANNGRGPNSREQ